MRIAYLLSKDPTSPEGGDLAISREMRSVLAADHDVRVVCLSDLVDSTTHDDDAVRVPKPPRSALRLAWTSLRTGRSLVHARFDAPALTEALDRIEADLYLAEHSYMVEPFLGTRWAAAGAPLLLNTVNPESSVWATSHGRIGRLDLARLRRDELRTARAARSVGCYDAEEAAAYRAAGIDARWLDVSFAPLPQIAVGGNPPRLAFVGYRDWPPNQDAFERLVSWWPDIARGIPGAELVVVGLPARGARSVPLPDGVRDLGYVADIGAVLATCRGLVAPITTGGGVRVKILDAARRGLPVVATPAAIGSLGDVLELAPAPGRAAVVEQSRALLTDPLHAEVESARIHGVNAQRWADGSAVRSFTSWVDSAVSG